MSRLHTVSSQQLRRSTLAGRNVTPAIVLVAPFGLDFSASARRNPILQFQAKDGNANAGSSNFLFDRLELVIMQGFSASGALNMTSC